MKYIAPAILAFLLVGCSEDRDARARISSLEARVSSLETQLAAAGDEAKKLASSLGSVQVGMWSKIESESAAAVDPASKGYAIARNEYGAFPVIIEDAQPYLDGHKVKFRVGNLTSAAMTDVKLDIVYGVRDPAFPTRDQKLSEAESAKAFEQFFATVEQNKKTRRRLTVDAGKDFAPASWNTVEAIISPSKPEDLGRLEVSVKITGMKLSTPK